MNQRRRGPGGQSRRRGGAPRGPGRVVEEPQLRGAFTARNRQLGVFLIVLGALGLWLNFKTYVPSIRAGDLGPVAYPMLALWAVIAIGLVLLGARIIVTGEDSMPE